HTTPLLCSPRCPSASFIMLLVRIRCECSAAARMSRGNASPLVIPLFPVHTPAMLSKVRSAAVKGIEAYPVEVEVNAGYGDTVLVVVGLPDTAVKESRDRVMTALINSGFT